MRKALPCPTQTSDFVRVRASYGPGARYDAVFLIGNPIPRGRSSQTLGAFLEESLRAARCYHATSPRLDRPDIVKYHANPPHIAGDGSYPERRLARKKSPCVGALWILRCDGAVDTLSSVGYFLSEFGLSPQDKFYQRPGRRLTQSSR